MRDDLIWDVEGWRSSPAAALEAQFNRVAGQQMADLPFYQAHMPIKACGFQLFEGQWVGAMLTPWMLELVVLPGPDQQCRAAFALANPPSPAGMTELTINCL